MNEWFKSFSATFAGGAVAIALVAIPTYVWLPREFDQIKVREDKTLEEAQAASEDAKAARQASEDAREASTSTLARMDGLVESIARMDAKPIFQYDFVKGGDFDKAAIEAQLAELGYKDMMTPDVVALLANSGKIAQFKFSSFGGNSWVFVKMSDFNEFSLEDQKKIEEVLGRSNTHFIKD